MGLENGAAGGGGSKEMVKYSALSPKLAMLKDRRRGSGSVLGGEHEIDGLKLESSLLGIKV